MVSSLCPVDVIRARGETILLSILTFRYCSEECGDESGQPALSNIILLLFRLLGPVLRANRQIRRRSGNGGFLPWPSPGLPIVRPHFLHYQCELVHEVVHALDGLCVD